MASFGSTKNSLQKLRTYLARMQLQQKTQKIALRQIQQQNLRLANNEVFLPLLNFIIIEYSSQFYIRVLDRVPDLKLKDDRKFVENCINIARDMLNLNAGLTADQFLTNKYFQKKLQFISNLSKLVYEWSVEMSKKSKGRQKQIYNQMGVGLQFSTMGKQQLQMQKLDNEFDDFQEQVPMKITAVPMKIDMPDLNLGGNLGNNKTKPNWANNKLKQVRQQEQLDNGTIKNLRNVERHNVGVNKQKKFVIQGQQFNEQQIQEALQSRHPTPQHYMKPSEHNSSVFPENKKHKRSQLDRQTHVSRSNQEQGDGQDSEYNRFKLDKKKNEIHTLGNNSNEFQTFNQNKMKTNTRKFHHQQHQTQQLTNRSGNQNKKEQFVSRQQFNQIVNLMKIVSETVNSVTLKFADLQSSINGQIQNINARVLMLQSKVKVLQDNL